MGERDEIIKELKHLVQYYQQASHEFFDDACGELKERIDTFYGCLEENKNSLEEYRNMIEYLINFQTHLQDRVKDLSFLTDRMNQLFKAPPL